MPNHLLPGHPMKASLNKIRILWKNIHPWQRRVFLPLSAVTLLDFFTFITLMSFHDYILILEIRYLGEAEVVFTCPINYSDFPFHVATCRLRMTSFTADNSSMRFRHDMEPWPPGQVKICKFFYLLYFYVMED